MRGRSSRYFRIPEKAHRNGVSVRMMAPRAVPNTATKIVAIAHASTIGTPARYDSAPA
jgi:hypothetical protein